MSVPSVTILTGNCLDLLKTVPEASVQCCVTSPPYWGLRNYGVDGQLGLEKTPQEYVATMVAVFREVRRVLKDDGVLFLNLGDSYTGSPVGTFNGGGFKDGSVGRDMTGVAQSGQLNKLKASGLKQKDLIGIPWRVAFALQDDGWWLRSEITWCKRAPMPESVTDRPSSATEKIFMLTKSAKYFYDSDAVRNEPSEALLQQIAEGYNGHATKLFEDNGVQDASAVKSRIINGARKRVDKQRGHSRRHAGFNDRWDHMTKTEQMACGSNLRNYWLIGPEAFAEAHFATFPSEIPKRCILLGSRPGDTVLDPFLGSGTTGMVALELARSCIGIELNPTYAELCRKRCDVTPGLVFA